MNQTQQNNLKQQKLRPDPSSIETLIRLMLKKHRTPFMLIKRSVLQKQYHRFRKCLPEVTPYYAIKANPHPGIIKTFVKLGASFDVASANEMKEVLRLGATPSKIIFANTIKSNEDLEFSRRRTTKMVNSTRARVIM